MTHRPCVYIRGFDADLSLRLSVNFFCPEARVIRHVTTQRYVDIESLFGTDFINEHIDHRTTIN